MRGKLKEFNFKEIVSTGLFVGAGGFEDRSLAFVKRLKKTDFNAEHYLLLDYQSQREDNAPNQQALTEKVLELSEISPSKVCVNAKKPIHSSAQIEQCIKRISSQIENRSALIDISGMTHLWALTTIHSCLKNGFKTSVVYTEAKSYFPRKSSRRQLLTAWKLKQYETAAKFLQSAGLKEVQVTPDFAGNFRPGAKTCLIIFAGYEPNRIQGLVDLYAPSAIIVYYGKSPHPNLEWRTSLSRDLHQDIFAQWLIRSCEASTLYVEHILAALEKEFKVIHREYDIAIAPQCGKMQGLAAYLFWRKHPEVQLLFTSPVRFNPELYSKGAGSTFLFQLS